MLGGLNVTGELYRRYADARAGKSPLAADCAKAWAVGGGICAVGEGLRRIFLSLLGDPEDAGLMVSVVFVALTALFTGLGVFDKLARHAGGGTLVPITGFANSVASAALDSKSEGWITADGALAPDHDAAHVHWGGGWRMPTKQELDDLVSKCNWKWTTVNSVQGWVITGKDSASIFLPCAGYGYGTSLSHAGSYGSYWSSVSDSDSFNSAWDLDFLTGSHGAGYGNRYYGRSVRPVQGFTE